jgi:acyl carrier protein
MSNIEQYNTAFMESFMIDAGMLPSLKYQAIQAWDSVGHMHLMSALEEAFGIEMDTDDIIDFSSYEKGREILKKYRIEL